MAMSSPWTGMLGFAALMTKFANIASSSRAYLEIDGLGTLTVAFNLRP